LFLRRALPTCNPLPSRILTSMVRVRPHTPVAGAASRATTNLTVIALD
jgi:hypothetical protein